jgi:hypothetical protein
MFIFSLACIVVRLLYCLLDWLMILPVSMFSDGYFKQQVFDVIENSMHMDDVGVDLFFLI